MTGKKFWCLEEYKGVTSVIIDGRFAPTNGWLCNKLNELHEENQVLREALKNQYINEICETCKFGQYDVNWYGEGEFECLKRHDAVECDGKTECEDFELDLERFLE